jgi:type II secretory pathway pseudopilin PulG
MKPGKRSQQSGFTYLMALLLVALTSAGTAAIAETWSHARQREKEAELLWIGNQFKQAIGLYYQRSPGTVKRYPEKLEDLLEDNRFLTRQRYLRRIYANPMTRNREWEVVPAPQGGIMGIRADNRGNTRSGRQRVEFLYSPPVAAP